MSRRMRRFGNVFVAALLRSPLHRGLSRSLILISYCGRKSGREYTLPVAYAEDAEGLIVFAGHSAAKTWWRNMPGAMVRVRLRGVDFDADARVVRGSLEVRHSPRPTSPVSRVPRARSQPRQTPSSCGLSASGPWRPNGCDSYNVCTASRMTPRTVMAANIGTASWAARRGTRPSATLSESVTQTSAPETRISSPEQHSEAIR